MGIFSWFKGHKPHSLTRPADKPHPATRAIGIKDGVPVNIGDAPSQSGVYVTEETALGVSAVYCAVNVIAKNIGKLPFVLYRRSGKRHDVAADHPLTPLLDVEPNPECTARVFWETFVSHCLLWGNGYAEVVRDGSGRPVEMWVIHPRNVTPLRDRAGRQVYRVRVGEVDVTLDAADVIHVPGLSPDSSEGYNLLKLARDNIGFSVQADAYGQAYFSNMGNVGVYLSHPGTLSDNARENLRRSFQKQAVGVDKTGSVYVLEEGLSARRETLSNEAAQYDETRRYQISEASRLFDITPVKLHELGRATWANLSVLNTDFWDTSCSSWAGKIEAEANRKLLLVGERGTYYTKFDADELTRGDRTTRYTNYAIGCKEPFLTVEEIREWEGLPPLPVAPKLEPTVPQPADQGDDQEQPAEQPTPNPVEANGTS